MFVKRSVKRLHFDFSNDKVGTGAKSTEVDALGSFVNLERQKNHIDQTGSIKVVEIMVDNGG